MTLHNVILIMMVFHSIRACNSQPESFLWPLFRYVVHVLDHLPGDTGCAFGKSLHDYVRYLLFDAHLIDVLSEIDDDDLQSALDIISKSENPEGSFREFSFGYSYSDELSFIWQMTNNLVIEPFGLRYVTEQVRLPDGEVSDQLLYLLDGAVESGALTGLLEVWARYFADKLKDGDSFVRVVLNGVPSVETI